MKLPVLVAGLLTAVTSSGCAPRFGDWDLGIEAMLESFPGHLAANLLVAHRVSALGEREMLALPGEDFEVDAEFVRDESDDGSGTSRCGLVSVGVPNDSVPGGELLVGPILYDDTTVPSWSVVLATQSEKLCPTKSTSDTSSSIAVYLSPEPLPTNELFRLELTTRDLSADPRVVGVRCVSVSRVNSAEILRQRKDDARPRSTD